MRTRLGWIAMLVATGQILWRVPIGRPASPALHRFTEFTVWFERSPTPDQAVALLRIVALALIAYMLSVTLLMLVAVRTRSRSLNWLVGLVTPRSIRTALAPVLGWAMFLAPLPVGQITSDLGTRQVADQLAPVELVFLGPVAGGEGFAAETPQAELKFLGADPAASLRFTTTADYSSVLVEPAVVAQTERATWTIHCGDHFWSIAERVLTDRNGERPSDQRLRSYWLQLIEANRAELPDPSNPDLILPGMIMQIPPFR